MPELLLKRVLGELPNYLVGMISDKNSCHAQSVPLGCHAGVGEGTRSVVAAAYRGDPAGDFSKGFLVGSSALLEGTIPKTIIVWYVQIVVETARL